ncbi:sulfotransferase family 2 domain-containing protein [Sphingomonas sp. PB2P19]|uniref:sulfotransferase family 2 domain-containing protein n=1 Tax=Sphingomonas rhamnosi TaxID=3096156 RepID=UPI002FC59A2A
MQFTPLTAKSYRWRRHLAGLFAVKLTGDIPERLIGMGLPVPLNAKRRRRLAAIRASDVLFIHVPKNAGTSVSMALYGQTITHDTMRYYESVAPDFVASAITVAIVRDPVERFVSAFRFAKSGGAHRQVSAPFRSTYANFASIDDALDHLEQQGNPFAIDHIFRSQSWYLTDTARRLKVKHLIPIDDLGRLGHLLPDRKLSPVLKLNESYTAAAEVSPARRERICRLYRDDMVLWERAR